MRAIARMPEYGRQLEDQGKVTMRYHIVGAHGGAWIYDVDSHEEFERAARGGAGVQLRALHGASTRGHDGSRTVSIVKSSARPGGTTSSASTATWWSASGSGSGVAMLGLTQKEVVARLRRLGVVTTNKSLSSLEHGAGLDVGKLPELAQRARLHADLPGRAHRRPVALGARRPDLAAGAARVDIRAAAGHSAGQRGGRPAVRPRKRRVPPDPGALRPASAPLNLTSGASRGSA